MLDCQNNSTGRLAATSNILRNFIHSENPASSVNSIVEISRKFDQLANCIHSFGTYFWPVLLEVEKCFFFLRKPFKADFASNGEITKTEQFAQVVGKLSCGGGSRLIF